ncbi:hypothetical protein FOZ63_026817, partial [Perkinsus olseni]
MTTVFTDVALPSLAPSCHYPSHQHACSQLRQASHRQTASRSTESLPVLENKVEVLKEKLNVLQMIETGHFSEVNRTHLTLHRAREQQKNNEASRQACIASYNHLSVALNSLLSDMINGAGGINADVDVANKVKRRMQLDLAKFDERVKSLNTWLRNMDGWSSFVLAETHKLDRGQARLLQWGQRTRSTMNMHEASLLKLGRELFNLETLLLSTHESLLAAGGA